MFVEPDAGVRPVVDFIGGARQSLDVAMYLLSDREVINALQASRRRGVQVRVMLEENPYGSGPGNRAVFDRLQGAAISVRWSPPNFTFSHAKYAIVDHQAALVGTANWTHSAFVGNREYIAVDTDPRDVDELVALFNADWDRQKGSVNDQHLVISPLNSRTDFLALAGNAQHALDLESEEMEDSGIESALVEAARRGVTVEVVLPSPTSQPDGNADGIQRLARGGVKVRRLRSPYVHGKDMVVDGREAFVGSENFSRTSLDQNREVGLLISDPRGIQRLEDTFRHDWEAAQP